MVAEEFHSFLVSDEGQRHTALCSQHNSKHVWKPKNCELYTLIFSLSYFLMTFFWAASSKQKKPEAQEEREKGTHTDLFRQKLQTFSLGPPLP